MKANFFVSLVAALTLTIFIPAGAGAIGVGKQCGGFPGLPCDEGLFCQKKPGTCAVIDMSGTCVRVPHVCPRVTGPTIQVCGCNGETYINDCERQKAMVSLAHKGKCQ
jgi:hypothetical protein